MEWERFIVVGENIHCTRIVKRGGKWAIVMADGSEAVTFTHNDQDRSLPVPPDWGQLSPAFDQGNIKHAALAIHQSMNGSGKAKQAGDDYLCWMAESQVKGGTTYLDVNVDEYSNDSSQNVAVMRYLVAFLSARVDTPLSIDSSNPATLQAGLEGCRRDIARPMLNSVSLERPDGVGLAVAFEADAIVNAAGAEGMPCGVEERLTNLREIVGLMGEAGVAPAKMHLDPLVLPISTDPTNGTTLLQAYAEAAEACPGCHLNGGLSNISFGMPNRKLLNMVFTYLCVEAGGDGGIIDPVSMPVSALAALDPAAESFRLAKAVLTGEDMFGMEYITAYREGRLT